MQFEAAAARGQFNNVPGGAVAASRYSKNCNVAIASPLHGVRGLGAAAVLTIWGARHLQLACPLEPSC